MYFIFFDGSIINPNSKPDRGHFTAQIVLLPFIF